MSAGIGDAARADGGGQAGAAAPSAWSGTRIAMPAAAWTAAPAGEPARSSGS
jgi:hypothetical protein